jgi:hypothetical protein
MKRAFIKMLNLLSGRRLEDLLIYNFLSGVPTN